MSEVSTEPAVGAPGVKDGARRTWATVAKSGGYKILVLPLGAVVGLVITRLVITHYGEAAYGQYGLLVGIANLMPFVDLGLSAAIMNAVASAEDPSNDPDVRKTMISALRLLVASALIIVTVAVLITLLGDWQSLLGGGLTSGSGSMATGLCLALIGLAVPFGFGRRLLTGLGRNHVTILLNALNRPLVLGVLAVMILLGAPFGGYVAVLVYAAALAIAVVTTVLASRQISPLVGRAIREAVHLRSIRGAKVFHLAWPMLLQMIALPIAMQSDRIVLSHVSGLEQLNQYNFANQLYTPIWLVISSAGISLWSVFARERAGIKGSGTSPRRMAAVFAALAAVAVLGVGVLAPVLSQLATSGTIELPLLLIVSFSLLTVLRGVNYPLGMFMTDARGLRFQAFMIVLMLPLNLGLSIALAEPLGASGPIIGSTAGILLCQVVPNWLYVRHAQRAEDSRDLGEQA